MAESVYATPPTPSDRIMLTCVGFHNRPHATPIIAMTPMATWPS
ncbi:hypothetical protein HMPREF9621_00495 [Cutibacterium modestum HL037PA2]|uniref:Uncharacterized protein n=1 Tax=Cutibacterium modestum HL044PA1 TaxID=765109 RepID=A0ABN0C3I1_9ACTN|nr:hypothetical protein HMPREF9621_00495 [Cutibacterium modestum HL037PA2]EFS91657.1 hypothetical protein HMPREF9607_02164 [Cutibacterium modestum HL044PA1]